MILVIQQDRSDETAKNGYLSSLLSPAAKEKSPDYGQSFHSHKGKYFSTCFCYNRHRRYNRRHCRGIRRLNVQVFLL